MKKDTHRDTPRSVKVAPSGVTPHRMWRALKELEPHNTEKRLADALSVQGGEDISHRTVGGWRYKLPSGKHIILILTTWPELIFRVTAKEIGASEARHQRLTGALEELENPSNARNECTTEDDSGGR